MADVTLALYILVTFYMALTIRTNSTITFINSFSELTPIHVFALFSDNSVVTTW